MRSTRNFAKKRRKQQMRTGALLPNATKLAEGDACKLLILWWTWPGSNRRPLPCHGSALPAAPQAHFKKPLEPATSPARPGRAPSCATGPLLRDTSTSCPLRTTSIILAYPHGIVNACTILPFASFLSFLSTGTSGIIDRAPHLHQFSNTI